MNYPLQYFAQQSLSDTADVVFPVPAGVDPAFWRPSIADISAVQSADLILLNGAGFATWTAKVSLPRSKIVDTSRGLKDRLITTQSITHSHGDGGEHAHEGTAAYLWLDPALDAAQASAVAEAIKARGLEDPDVIDKRFDALVDTLARLEETVRAKLNDVPPETVFVATYPRYQYLAQAYGLTILSLEWEAGAAPSEAEIADLRAVVEEGGARVLILEAKPPTEARAEVSALGIRDLVFPLLATPGKEGSFVDAYDAAIDRLVEAAIRAEGG